MEIIKLQNPNEAVIKKTVTKNREKENKLKNKKRTAITYFSSHTEISNDASFLKQLRLALNLNRTEASNILGMSVSTIKRYETGISEITTDKLDYFLKCYCVSRIEYMSFKAGKEVSFSKEKLTPKVKVIENNLLRRSYKKIITEEVRAITHLRTIKGLNQQELTTKCGWSRTAISHIENGRIELTEEKLKHILKALEVTLKKFKQYLDSSFDRTFIEKKCIKKILDMDSSKLKSIETILENF